MPLLMVVDNSLRRPDRIDLGGDIGRFELQRQGLHGRFVHFDQGDISRLVRPQHLAGHLTARCQFDRYKFVVCDHVVVGQKIPIPGDKKAAAVTTFRL